MLCYAYQYKRRFSPFVMPRVTAYSSSCRLCLAMRQLQVTVELRRSAQTSIHCVTDVNRLHHKLELRHHLPATIPQLRDVRTLCNIEQSRKREKKNIYYEKK